MTEAYASPEAIAGLTAQLRALNWRRLVCRFDPELLVLAPRLIWSLQEQLWQQEPGNDSSLELYLSLDQTGESETDEVSGLRAAADALVCFQASTNCRRVQSTLPVVYVNLQLKIIPNELVTCPNGEQDGLEDAFLRKRLALMNRLRDEARIFGLITVNLSLPYCLEATRRVRELLQRKGRNVYCFHMTSITPAKLANFAEIDAFVLFSDAKYFMDIESHHDDFWKPILTPYEVCLMLSVEDEVELATKCSLPTLYTFDLEVAARWRVPLISTETTHRVDDTEQRHVLPSTVATLGETSILPANQAYGSDFAGGRLQKRSWKGLEISESPLEPHRAVPGRAGRACAYTDELERLGSQPMNQENSLRSIDR
jgi:hypothetical protein